VRLPQVSVFYDPMISKLVVWAPDRSVRLRPCLLSHAAPPLTSPQRALKLLKNSLAQYEIIGPPTNISFLQRCLTNGAFQKGGVTTNFIKEQLAELLPESQPVRSEAMAAAVVWLITSREARSVATAGNTTGGCSSIRSGALPTLSERATRQTPSRRGLRHAASA
jgi:3-methylcrotonyl-CoA carboxylase alpha subunit